MQKIITTLFRTKPAQTIWACCIGSFWWSVMQSIITTEYTIPIPIHILHSAPHHDIIAPSAINITISGTRSECKKFLATSPYLSLDATKWYTGIHTIPLTHHDFHLPSSLRLINYSTIMIVYLQALP